MLNCALERAISDLPEMVLNTIYFFKSTKLETLFGYAGWIATTLWSNKHWFTLDSQMTIKIGKNGF